MHISFLHRSTAERRDQILNGSVPITLITLSAPTLMQGLMQALIGQQNGQGTIREAKRAVVLYGQGIAENSTTACCNLPAAFGVCLVVQGAFIGLGRTKIPLILSILRIWFFRYIFILCTQRWLSFYSVF